MEAAVGHSTREDPAEALDEALAQVAPKLQGRAELAVLLATSEYADDAQSLAARACMALGRPALVGGSTTGVITAEGEHEDQRGLALLAVRGVRARAALVSTPAELERFSRPASLRLALPDPRRLDPELLAAVCSRPGALAGAGLAGRSQALFAIADGAAGEGPFAMAEVEGLSAQVVVAQGADPVTPFEQVTRARRNAVLEVGGRKACAGLKAHLEKNLSDPSQLPNLLFVALRKPGADAHVVRPIVGVDSASGALQLPDDVEEGMELAFAWRETLGAVRDLNRALQRLEKPEQVKAALYFNCDGRGRKLHLEPDADLRAIRTALPGVPILGMTSSFELGPAGDRSRLLMYSGVLVALREA
ncbi:MAG: FIST C-terminal domain-containing protein [Deltaproteobacteria bacterium]|nr:FIST C-terminal domain-containing protein [Deltaproteobacteria bacterium]